MPVRKRHLDMSGLLLMEEDVVCRTRSAFGDREWRWRTIIDELLRLPHFEGELEPIETQFGEFQRHVRTHYAQMPYTVLTVHRLWRTGYYVEALTLVRHLLEVFVQLRYLLLNPTVFRKHVYVTPKNPKGRVPFRTMFEALSPGLYDEAFRLLATFAHGGATIVARGKIVDHEKKLMTTIVGCEFEPVHSGLVLTHLSAIVFGYLNYHSDFFPANTLAADSQLSGDLANTRSWLQHLMEAGLRDERSKAFFELLQKLVGRPSVT